MTQAHKLTYGYLPNFRGDHVVLFAGDQQSLECMADLFDKLACGTANLTAMLHTELLFAPNRGVPLTLTVTDAKLGMRRVGPTSSEPRLEWRISKDIATRFAGLTRAVAAMDEPAHQYLDTDGEDEVTVIVSKGEYDEEWLNQQR
ncbi:MAG: hypothetical protein ABI612_23130 [Betaproteobacteria bacterium]